MRISELIAELTILGEKHGNLHVGDSETGHALVSVGHLPFDPSSQAPEIIGLNTSGAELTLENTGQVDQLVDDEDEEDIDDFSLPDEKYEE